MADVDERVGPPVRVVVADDHVPYRRGISGALSGRGFEVCAEAADGPAAVRAALEHQPDIVLRDISMPGGDGLTATAEITSRLPEAKVVMLTSYYDDENLFAAIKAGASGYLLKGSTDEDLPHRLREVLAGEPSLSAGLVTRVLAEFRHRERPRLGLRRRGVEKLTEREWEILELLRDGLTTVQIADHLSLEPVSIRANVTRILKKLRVKDRGALLRLMHRGHHDP
jgi:DNA-binding NarL/FixJ family response regulator